MLVGLSRIQIYRILKTLHKGFRATCVTINRTRKEQISGNLRDLNRECRDIAHWFRCPENIEGLKRIFQQGLVKIGQLGNNY